MAALAYSVLDPAGNVTALVEDAVDSARRPAAAAALMRLEPSVEQVGFLDAAAQPPALCMAGGEFCGNASICAAALLLLRGGEDAGAFTLRVSGAEEPVRVSARREGETRVGAAIRMPAARGLERVPLRFAGREALAPLVRMQGISHLILEPDSALFALRDCPAEAELAVRQFSAALGAEGLGLMFLERADGMSRLTPLVFVPGSGTVFWEHSCASGSAAAGMLLAARSGRRTELTLAEPGGTLRVVSDPDSGETWLHSAARLVARRSLEL